MFCASKDCKYSFCFFLDRYAASRFLISRCCFMIALSTGECDEDFGTGMALGFWFESESEDELGLGTISLIFFAGTICCSVWIGIIRTFWYKLLSIIMELLGWGLIGGVSCCGLWFWKSMVGDSFLMSRNSFKFRNSSGLKHDLTSSSIENASLANKSSNLSTVNNRKNYYNQ